MFSVGAKRRFGWRRQEGNIHYLRRSEHPITALVSQKEGRGTGLRLLEVHSCETRLAPLSIHLDKPFVRSDRFSSVEGVIRSVLAEVRLDFSEFYEREFERVYRAAWVIARQDDVALEAAQEAFARAWARWGRLRTKEWTTGWVIKTAINVVRDGYPRDPRAAGIEMADEPLVPELLDLRAALRRLPARRREALILFYIGELPISAVAQLMGTTEGTVKAHLAQGRAALRLDLGEHDDE